MRRIGTLVGALAILAGLGVAAGFGGALHPMGDSFAVFREPLSLAAASLGVVALALGWRTGAVPAGVGAAGLLTLLVGGSGATGETLRLYQKNLLWLSASADAVIADALASEADAVTLQEVTDAIWAATTVPNGWTVHRCAFGSVGGTAVLTTLPPAGDAPVCAAGLSAIRVIGPSGPVWLVSIHLHWPWPYAQAEQVEALLPVLDGLEGPVIVAGDFNMVPWSHAVGRIEAVTGTTAMRPPVRSWDPAAIGVSVPLFLAIDHVLAPAGGVARARPPLGSDHLGVLATVGLGP